MCLQSILSGLVHNPKYQSMEILHVFIQVLSCARLGLGRKHVRAHVACMELTFTLTAG